MKTLTQVTAAALLAATLAACGTTGAQSPAAVRVDAGSVTQSTSGLKKAFTRIHKAIFTAMDADKNGWLDEYEAGKHMTLKDFQKADTATGWGSAGRLSRTEFVNWATKTFLWFHDTPDSFANRFRQDLSKVFKRLDENRDGLLVKNEISIRDLSKLKLTFEYDKLRISQPIKKLPADAFAAADKTGDGKLSQAEFEDMYLEMVIASLGGEGAPAAASDEPVEPAN